MKDMLLEQFYEFPPNNSFFIKSTRKGSAPPQIIEGGGSLIPHTLSSTALVTPEIYSPEYLRPTHTEPIFTHCSFMMKGPYLTEAYL